MSFPSVIGFLKGLLIQDPNDRTKQFSVEVSSSATTGTRTTLVAAQTANRTITLPDSSATLMTTATTINATQIADGSVSNTEFQFLDGLGSNAQAQISANAAAIAAHIADATDAHTASAITNVPSGNLTAINVQDALNEIQTELDGFSGGGANLFLSNLSSPVAINQTLAPNNPDTINLGQLGNQYSEAFVGSYYAQLNATAFNRVGLLGDTSALSEAGKGVVLDANPGIDLVIASADSASGATNNVIVRSGEQTSTGDSGNIRVETGEITSGTRGEISLVDGSEGTAGHVWTSTNTSGAGAWAAAPVTPVNSQVSSSCGQFATTSNSFVDVTNLSVSITTTGRPVWVGLVYDGSEPAPFISCQLTSPGLAGSPNTAIQILRGATSVSFAQLGIFASTGTTQPSYNVPLGSVWHLDRPTAGTYTYKVQVKGSGSASTIQVRGAQLVAYEI